MEKVLEIQNLAKAYGRIKAVNQISFQVEKGSVHGLLGPNGSGKTTTLGMLLDIVTPDKGAYSWFGNPPSKDNRKRIGAILENPNFYPYLTGINNLKLVADIKNVPHSKTSEVLKKVNLYKRKNSKYKTYSLGMKQRLAIAAALLNDPEVLVLDEPTNGLDPQGIAEVRELIMQIATEGTTIILASHILDEVEKVCTHVTVLKNGNLLLSGSVNEVLADSDWVEVSAENMDQLKIILEKNPSIKSFKKAGTKFLVTLSYGWDAPQLNQYLFKEGIVASHISTQQKSLEKHFLEITN